VAYADHLVVNNMDLLQTPEDIERATNALRALHPTAPMQTTTDLQVPNLDWILNANCFGGSKRLEELDTIWNQATTTTTTPAAQEEEESSSTTHDHDHSHSHSHYHHGDNDNDSCAICASEPLPEVPQHKHTAVVKTLAFQHKGSVDLMKLNRWLAQVLWPNQDETDKVLTAMLKDPSDAAHKSKTNENKSTPGTSIQHKLSKTKYNSYLVAVHLNNCCGVHCHCFCWLGRYCKFRSFQLLNE
jgi:G3E family GTPase